MKFQWLMPVVLIAAVVFSGCLGGDSKEDKEPQYEVFTSGMTLTGGQQGLAQTQPEDIFVIVPIPLDFDKVIKLQINITISDNDQDTNPDIVGNMELREIVPDAEPNATVINGGNTDLETSVVVEWQNDVYLSSQWELHIPVSIVAGDDQWPGPFIWRGIPDRGFSYTLDITYEYHDEPA